MRRYILLRAIDHYRAGRDVTGLYPADVLARWVERDKAVIVEEVDDTPPVDEAPLPAPKPRRKKATPKA